VSTNSSVVTTGLFYSTSIRGILLIQGWIMEATGPGGKPRHPSSQQHSPAPPRGSQAKEECIILDPEGSLHLYPVEKMASDLEEVTFILAASQLKVMA